MPRETEQMRLDVERRIINKMSVSELINYCIESHLLAKADGPRQQFWRVLCDHARDRLLKRYS